MSLLFLLRPVYLATQGQNPKTHLVKRELVRVCALTVQVSHLVCTVQVLSIACVELETYCLSQERVQQAMLRAKTITGRRKAGKWPFSVIHCRGLLFHSLVHGRRKRVLAISLALFPGPSPLSLGTRLATSLALPLVTFAVLYSCECLLKSYYCLIVGKKDYQISSLLNLNDSLKATTCICVLVWKNLSLL